MSWRRRACPCLPRHRQELRRHLIQPDTERRDRETRADCGDGWLSHTLSWVHSPPGRRCASSQPVRRSRSAVMHRHTGSVWPVARCVSAPSCATGATSRSSSSARASGSATANPSTTGRSTSTCGGGRKARGAGRCGRGRRSRRLISPRPSPSPWRAAAACHESSGRGRLSCAAGRSAPRRAAARENALRASHRPPRRPRPRA